MFNFLRFKKYSKVLDNNAKKQIVDQVSQKIIEHINTHRIDDLFIPRSHQAPLDKEIILINKSKSSHKPYVTHSSWNLRHIKKKSNKDTETFHDLRDLIKTNPSLNKKFESLATRVNDFDLQESGGVLDEIPRFSKFMDKCFYCGRDLYSGSFTAGDIHLEHMVDKSSWYKVLIEALQNLKYIFQSKKDFSVIQDDLEIVCSLLKKNPANSLQNWALADKECNESKGALDHISYIKFMNEIADINEAEIIRKNNIAIEETRNENKPNKVNMELFNFQFGARSFEIFHYTLSQVLENADIDNYDIIQKSLNVYTKTTLDDTRTKTNELIQFLSLPANKYIVVENNLEPIIECFLQNQNQTANNFKDKDIVFQAADKCHCAICGNKVMGESILNHDSSPTLFDVTYSASEFHWQLVHRDCAQRCPIMSLRYLRYLANLIHTYTPQRDMIIKTLGTDINKIFQLFKNSLEKIKSFVQKDKRESEEVVAFNLKRFLRRA